MNAFRMQVRSLIQEKVDHWELWRLGRRARSALHSQRAEGWNGDEMKTSWSTRYGARVFGICVAILVVLGLAMPMGGVGVRAVAARGVAKVGAQRTVARSPALAAGRWSVVSSPNAMARQGDLMGVSCTSGGSCTAVGQDDNGALAEGWSGRKWVMQQMPKPVGAIDSHLSSVSCTSAKACMAVGSSYFLGSSRVRTLGERWNGSKWSVQATPNPAGAPDSRLLGISCTSPKSCIAVGSYSRAGYAGGGTLAERWNGKNWAILSSVDGDQAVESRLTAVACTSAKACTAVGYSWAVPSPYVALVERWDGKRWTVQATPKLAGSRDAYLMGVSCVSLTACTAVGYDTVGIGRPAFTLTETWSGMRWVIQKTPRPAVAGGLSGVSCASTRACVAVGNSGGPSGAGHAVAERWNGKAWTVQTLASPPADASSLLLAVSCTATKTCTAVGHFFHESAGPDLKLAERWNGNRWSIQAMPPAITQLSYLWGVSCTSATACIATGNSGSTNGNNATLAERWNGRRWAIQPTTSNSAGPVLTNVSCTSARACTAVGHEGDDMAATAAERWNGKTWTVQPTSSPGDARGQWLADVSCTSLITCIAVGYFYPGGYGDNGCPGTESCAATVDRWNGTSWNYQATPLAAYTMLDGISCTSPNACTAVGYGGDFYGTLLSLAMRWDGRIWSIQPTPNPAGAHSSYLSDVSCTSENMCVAVGHYTTSAGTEPPLIERWDGRTWSIEPAPSPPAADRTSLVAVSCSSATACTAVGEYRTSSTGPALTLAERWDAKSWTIQSTRNPGGSHGSHMSGVSCLRGVGCTAVGYYNNGRLDLTLVERSPS